MISRNNIRSFCLCLCLCLCPVLVTGATFFFILLIRDSQGPLRERLARNLMTGWLIRQNDQIQLKAKTMTLNYAMPSFDDLRRSLTQEAPPESVASSYIEYYEKVVNYFPQLSGAHALLGFCYYNQGKTSLAIQRYLQAHQQAPDVFWHSYNPQKSVKMINFTRIFLSPIDGTNV
jgi:tetratricopeptide (TPR) repeat protein